MRCDGGAVVQVEFDFRHTGAQTWDIDFETDVGPIKLSAGGSELNVSNTPRPLALERLRTEYSSIYEHFADLVRARCTEVDARPMQLVADIFLIGKRVMVEAFVDSAP
jgi:D-galactose 1-dehydrogenase